MKNLFLSLAFASVLLTSCTSDDAATPSAGGPLPTKIVTTYSGSTTVATSTFTYSGNKILEENISPQFDISKIKYTYTGNNITKIERFAGSSFDAYGGENMTYENGKIKTSTTIAVAGYNGDLRKESFVYNADGTVTTTSSFINQTTGVETPTGRQMRYTYTNGFLTKSESISSGIVGQVVNYTNDAAKNAAFKNVVGFNEFAMEGTLRLTADYVGSTVYNKTYTYSYNTANYPSQVVEPNAYGSQTKTQVFTY